MDDRLHCAALSIRRHEPVHATASRVRRWVVVEQPGPWGRDALFESRLDHLVARTLHAQGRRHGARIVLARRPRWAPLGERRRVHLARTAPEGGWIEQLDVDNRALAALDLSILDSPTAPGVGERGPAALTLVCTNGRHDPCCADFGRPVVRALAAAGVDDVWECSHIGGDRFAANVVSLPTGIYLGRVPPERAVEIVHDVGKGLITLDHYRGRCCFPPIVQAAEIAVRRKLGESRLEALRLLSWSNASDDEMTARFHHTGSSSGHVVEVTVRRRRTARVPLTCAGNSGHPWVYEAVAVRYLPA
jgi:hypothetical protein